MNENFDKTLQIIPHGLNEKIFPRNSLATNLGYCMALITVALNTIATIVVVISGLIPDTP